MRVTIMRLTLCAIVLTVGLSLEAQVLIAFRSKAVVESGIVTLKEVADIQATNPADRQKLSAVIVGPAPGPDRTMTLEFETVRSRLLSAGVSLAEIQFSGPTTMTLIGPKSSSSDASRDSTRTAARPIPSGSGVQSAIEAAIRRYLTAQGGGQSYAVSARIDAESLATIASAEKRGFEIAGGAPPWTGTQNFTVRFLDPNDVIQRLDVNCEVSLRPSILAAKHALPRGHVVCADDLVWKKSENGEEANCATDPKLVLGMETQQTLRTGQAISYSSLKAIPLVRNGQFVTVTSRRPGMSVQRVMKAKVDGTAGEVIALLTLEDRKTVFARVTGLQEAEVVENGQTISPPADPISTIARIAAPALPKLDQSRMTSPDRTESLEFRVHVNPVQALSVPELY